MERLETDFDEFNDLDIYQINVLNETYLGLAENLGMSELAVCGAVSLLNTFTFETMGAFAITGELARTLREKGILDVI